MLELEIVLVVIWSNFLMLWRARVRIQFFSSALPHDYLCTYFISSTWQVTRGRDRVLFIFVFSMIPNTYLYYIVDVPECVLIDLRISEEWIK